MSDKERRKNSHCKMQFFSSSFSSKWTLLDPCHSYPFLYIFNSLWCHAETLTCCQVVASWQVQLSTSCWWKPMQERVRQKKRRVAESAMHMAEMKSQCLQLLTVSCSQQPVFLVSRCSQHCLSPSSGRLKLIRTEERDLGVAFSFRFLLVVLLQ